MILDNIWVINLDTSKDRLQLVEKQFRELNLKFNRYSAVYGKSLSDETINIVANKLCTKLLCNYAIIGCALSHKQLWEQLINDDNASSYLILEDDVKLTKKSIETIKKLDILQQKENIDMINLYGLMGPNTMIQEKYEIDDVKIGIALYPLTTTAYLLTKTGAKKLKQQLNEKLTYQIDYEIGMNALLNDFVCYVTYPFVVDVNDVDSTIGNKLNSIVIKSCDRLNLKKIAWLLSAPSITINMKHQINNIFMLYIILLIANKLYIKSKILYIFIICDMILMMS